MASPQKGSWRQPAQGKCSFPCDDWLEPERLTDDDVMLLLKLIFHRQDTQELLKKLLEREKPETP